MSKKWLFKSVTLIGVMVILSISTYGIVEKLSLEKMTQLAERIVLGHVMSVASQWEAVGKGKRIYTYVYVEVEKDIKGFGSRLIELKVPGGTVGDITEWVSDVPQFAQGERTVLFLRDERFQVVGWYQGKFSVKDNIVSGLGLHVDDFVTMIQKIDREMTLDRRDVVLTKVGFAGKNLKSPEGSFVGEPCKVRLNLPRAKSALNKVKPKARASRITVSRERVQAPASWSSIMTQGFEGTFPSGSWNVYGNPTWDEDDYKPRSGSYSAWCANGGAAGLDPQTSNYPNNMNAWMVYGPFDLSDAQDAELLFYLWLDSEYEYDYVMWMASLDGENFYGYQASGNSSGWQSENFDLTAVGDLGNLCGQSSVWIGIGFTSDTSNTAKGAFVDDIVLQKSTTGGLPNLTPYKPEGWANKIVVSNHTGDHNDDSPLYASDTLYIDLAVANDGTAAANVTFYSRLYIDDAPIVTMQTDPPLDPGYYSYVEDYSIGSLSEGNHTLKIVADYDSKITESNELDNEYQRSIYIEAVGPNITNISPSLASAGTNTQVIISGSNFGATQDSSKVEFFYKSGSPKIEGSVVSWSDSQITCIVPVGLIEGYSASAGSGPVTVTTSAGTSNEYTFKVTFGNGNCKWAGTHPYVNYEINENTADCTGEGTAIIAAVNEWNNAAAKFAFLPNGTTTATSASFNSHNELMWGSTGGSIATSTRWTTGSTILECDIVFEDSLDWATDGSAEKYDVQNIATHELGHWLALRDLYGNLPDKEYDAAKTMYGFSSQGDIAKRSLHADDVSGILWIYSSGGDTWDPSDDTSGGATILTPTDMEQSHGRHTLTSADNYDWYRISMTAGWTYYFRSDCDFPAENDGAGDTYAELFSDSGGSTIVASNDDSGGNLQFSFGYEAASSQDYYLRVKVGSAGKFWSGNIYYRKDQMPVITKYDFLATWDGQGVYYRNSEAPKWIKLASPADMIAGGDVEGDGIDDLIGIWPGQGGVWVRYSSTGSWVKLSSTAKHISAGDMNGDGRDDLLGTWDGQGVYYRNSISGAWVKLATPATLLTTGGLDGDSTDDLIGIWPTQGGVWVKYSQTSAWAKLSTSARDIATGDMDGDGREDLLGTWDGQGVYYKNSISGLWVKMSIPADQVTAGDLDGDGTDDLIGLWAGQSGVYVKYSKTGTWSKLSTPARDIAAGVMRGGVWGSSRPGFSGLQVPGGGSAGGPKNLTDYIDLASEGPGGSEFISQEERNLVPQERGLKMLRTPGPGEPGFRCVEQGSLVPIPGEQERAEREKRAKRDK